MAAGGPAVGDRRPVLDRCERRPAVPLAPGLLAEPVPRRRTRPRRPAVGAGRPHPRSRPPGLRAPCDVPRRPAAAPRGPARRRSRRARRAHAGPAVRLGGEGIRARYGYGVGEAGSRVAAGPAVGGFRGEPVVVRCFGGGEPVVVACCGAREPFVVRRVGVCGPVVVRRFGGYVTVVVACPEVPGPVVVGCFGVREPVIVRCLRTCEPVVIGGRAGDGLRVALGGFDGTSGRVRYGWLVGAR